MKLAKLPKPEDLKVFAFSLCLILAGVLLVVGVAKIYAPAGYIAAAGTRAGLGWLFFTGDADEPSEVPR